MKSSSKISAALAVTIPLLLGVTSVQAQTVVLKFGHMLPPNSNFHKNVAEPWCAAIEKDSAGKMKCQLYPALQLGGTPPQMADQVKNGVADIVWTSPSYSTGRFPRTEALELPFTLPVGGLSGARAMWEYTQKHGMEDYKDFKLLAVFSGSNTVISTSSKLVLSAPDLKGLKIRSPSRFTSLLLSSLGGTPVNMPITAVTEGISKGVIDGAMAPWEVLPAVKIDEVTKYHMEGPANMAGFSQTPFTVMMNKARYESLSPELKAVIDKHSGLAMTELAGRAWDQSNEAARKKLIGMGNKVLLIKEADYNDMKKLSASVESEWIKQANARGLDGARMVADLHAIGAKHLGR